jgi:outer membrane receptor protein involved in Fe transport
MDSKVADLGASITVVTKQQLIDTAAVDINDIFTFESNTEGINDYTAVLTSSPTNDQIQGSPQTAVRVRGLAAPNMQHDGFTMTSRIPIDTYNIDTVEISRGPNSTLSGLGSPSGTVNINTGQADLVRDSNEVSFRFDSFYGWRSTLNLNRALLRDKLGIRVALLDEDLGYTRKPSYDDQKRLFGALTYKPFPSTTIRVEYEHYKENRQTPNYLTPRDDVTEWVADGKPTWNPLTYTATANGVNYVVPESATATANLLPGTTGALPAGLFENTTNFTRPSMYIDGGQVQLWEVNRLANTNANTQTGNQYMLQGSGSLIQRGDVNPGGVAYNLIGISNKALYNWSNTNAVPEDWNYDSTLGRDTISRTATASTAISSIPRLSVSTRTNTC